MNERKIVFVVEREKPTVYEACLSSIEALRVPEGYTSQTVTITRQENMDYNAVYAQVWQQTMARYYIYVDESICFVNESFLADMLAIFRSDDQLGAIGMAGAKSLPLSGDWREAATKYGCYYYVKDGHPIEKCYTLSKAAYEIVQGLDSGLLALQQLLPYAGRPLPARTAAGWRQSMAAELQRDGWQLAVPRQETPWCLYSRGELAGSVGEDWLGEYAGYLSVSHEDNPAEWLLYRFGRSCRISGGYRFDTPEGIAIGNDVCIGRDAWLGLPYGNFSGKPRIELADGCDIGPRCVVSAVNHILLERGVSLEENVRIADYGACYADAGLAIHQQGANRLDGEVTIGAGSHLGANVVVEGNVRIGRGCLIAANSFVRKDIPDYCIVEGNPARVVKAFDWEAGQWGQVETADQLASLLEKRQRSKPVLTIGIPTCNRSYYLRQCLRHLFAAIGNDCMFEVYVSDNASTDDTAAVVQRYAARYSNLRYEKNVENIGPAKNFLKVWKSARGEYVMALGDDDYLNPDVFYELIKTIYADRRAAIVAMLPGKQPFVTAQLSGINAYVESVSYVSTAITSVLYRKKDFDQLPSYDYFFDTGLHQVAIQLEILHRNPRFSVLLGDLYAAGNGEAIYITPTEYAEQKKAGKLGDLGKVFMKHYLDILGYYKSYGLSEACLKEERRSLLENFILTWCGLSAQGMVRWGAEHVLEYYDVYYKDEPYYAEKRAELVKLWQK